MQEAINISVDFQENNLIKSDFTDELRLEGIKYLGYGIVPKFVMLDTDISAEAKAIYAYFCSYAGSGNTAFPGRDKILHDLSMSKDAYYKHYNQLIKEGYIKAEQVSTGGIGQGFKKNVYTLVSKPEKFNKSATKASENKAYAIIKASGLEADGYGFIPKAVMVDNTLPVKAKALYAYYCSFSGSEGIACPKKENIIFHLQFSHNTYNKYQKELCERNYIKTVQRQVDGRLCVNDVYIIDNPDKDNAQKGREFEIVCPKKQCTKINDTQELKQSTKKQNTQKQDSQIQYTQIQDTNNNKTKNNNLKKYQSNNQQRPSAADEGEIEGLLNKIVLDKAIPEYALENDTLVEKAVYFLSEYERLSDPKEHEGAKDSEFSYNSYMLFVDALIGMLSNYSKQIDGVTVTSKKVNTRLRRYILNYDPGEVYIHTLIEAAQAAYKEACKKTVPQYPIKFMQRIIWNVLVEGDIKQNSAIIHDFN